MKEQGRYTQVDEEGFKRLLDSEKKKKINQELAAFLVVCKKEQ